jgi:4-amino-4-deoxy-L-arabinose transferase-like glycosyltransferase
VRGVGEDALLALGVTMALLAFFQAQRSSTMGYSLLFVAGIAIATLSKGVLGLAMPGVVIFAYLLADNLMDKRLKIGDWLGPGLLTLVGLIPLLIWLAVLYQRGGAQAVGEVLLTNSVGRFSGSFVEAGHYEPFYYYLAKLPEAFLPWNILVYLGLWHFRKELKANRYLLFFSLWIVAQFIMLTLASSKRTVYLMSMTPAAAVIAAEYAGVLWGKLKQREGTQRLVGRIARHRQPLAIGVLTLVIGSYLAAAQWAMPRADKELSFLPLTEHIQTLQASGHQVALFQANERLGGASVFYTQSVLNGLDTDAQLKDFLAASTSHVAVMAGDSDPIAPFKVLKSLMVGRQAYYFVSY